MFDDLEYDINYLQKVTDYNKQKYEYYLRDIPFELNNEFEKILNARYHKNQRIKKRLIFLWSRYRYIWFVTFTFTNKNLKKSSRTKKDMIKKCINQKDFKFILNIDYGDTTEREHYHCILATNEDIDINKFIKDNYKGGFSLSLCCSRGVKDFYKLSLYLDKLVNHCTKATTKKQRVYYNFKGYDDFPVDSKYKTIFYHYDYNKLFLN